MTKKRLSGESSPQSKRTKNLSGKQSETYSYIDTIPSRSKVLESTRVSSSSDQVSSLTLLSYFKKSPKVTTSFSSSTGRSSSNSFSASNNTSFSSKNTSFLEDIDINPDDEFSEYFTSSDYDTEPDNELGGETRPVPLETLDKRLSLSFPKFANRSFNDAPLAVIWEIARISLHCGVKLENIDLHYSTGLCHDQKSLRNTIARLNSFKNKQLPPPVSHDAWDLGLKSFQSQREVVALSGELELNPSGNGPFFNLRLHPLHNDKGNRLQRRFGSDRFLEILIPSLTHVQKVTTCKEDTLIRWLTGKKHYFLGRQWVAFYCKNGSKKTVKGKSPIHRERIFFFACDGDSFRKSLDGSIPPAENAEVLTKRVKVDLHRMVEWAIGSLSTTEQQVPKLFSRISLSLTKTWATIVLEKHQIHDLQEDIGRENPMNDGIGRLSRSLAMKIACSLGLTETPCAFQGRFAGAKGMWLIDDNPPSPSHGAYDDWITTYPSQRKWDCSYTDVHHRTFEVKEWSKESKSAALNRQFIPLLEAQSIDQDRMRGVMARHLQNSLQGDLAAQRDAMDHPLDLRLWLRQCGGSKGNLYGDHMPFLGGLPRSTEDCIAFLVDSGFEQSSCEFQQQLCQRVATRRVEALKEKMNISVPSSTYLYMVADFSGTLEENEVSVSFSTKFQAEGFCDTLLENMEILVARAPAHLPTDIQRVKVVSHACLRHLKDVIVFSTKGASSLADKLSGGDFDGDKAWTCWDQDIVQNYRNASVPEYAVDELQKLDRPLSEIRQHESSIDKICAQFIYEGFSFNLKQSLLGKCTIYKEDYCYVMGSVTSKKIVSLSKILSCLVDQSKQGYIFTIHDWKLILKTLNLPPNIDRTDSAQRKGQHKKQHILDFLRDVAHETARRAQEDLNKSLKIHDAQQFDPDLTRLFNYFDERYGSSNEWKSLRQTLRDDIESVVKRWGDDGSDFSVKVTELYEQWLQIQPLHALRSSDFVQTLLEPWKKDRNSSTWALLKASFAFKLCYRSKPRFAWQMAGRQLGILKQSMTTTEMSGTPVVVRSEMYAALQPNRKYIERKRAQRSVTQEIVDFATETHTSVHNGDQNDNEWW